MVIYFCGTSDTSSTANSSDASKSCASVTRLLSYFPSNVNIYGKKAEYCCTLLSGSNIEEPIHHQVGN